MISNIYRINAESVTSLETYLQMTAWKWEAQSTDGKLLQMYALGANTYVKEAIRIAKVQIQSQFSCQQETLKKAPFTLSAYQPELVCSEEYNLNYSYYFKILNENWLFSAHNILSMTKLKIKNNKNNSPQQ